MPQETYRIIDINEILILFVETYKSDLAEMFHLLKGSVHQIFKAPEGETGPDLFKHLLSAIKQTYSEQKTPILIHSVSFIWQWHWQHSSDGKWTGDEIRIAAYYFIPCHPGRRPIDVSQYAPLLQNIDVWLWNNENYRNEGKRNIDHWPDGRHQECNRLGRYFEKEIQAEIESYIVTDGLAREYVGFVDTFTSDILETGVWISGFYGSGKSYLVSCWVICLATPILVAHRPEIESFNDSRE